MKLIRGTTLADILQHRTDPAADRGQLLGIWLPKAERQDWQMLWADVQELSARAGGRGAGPAK
jgi:hypothetical protein